MINRKTSNQLKAYLKSHHPIIFINNNDDELIDLYLEDINRNNEYCLCEFNNSVGAINFKNKKYSYELNLNSLDDFLYHFNDNYNTTKTRLLILRDINFHLQNDIKIISLIKDIAIKNTSYNKNNEYNQILIIISANNYIPPEIEKYITIFDVPLPSEQEIIEIINKWENSRKNGIEHPIIEKEFKKRLSKDLKGISRYEINQILDLAYVNGGYIEDVHNENILKFKKQFIRKTNLVELVNVESDNDNIDYIIGGLDNLKAWLKRRKDVIEDYSSASERYKVTYPKGILLVGIPGCGKSLSAKAVSILLKLPLLKLDIGNLMGKYVGESKENFRNAIKITEAVSPCVLWVDEIEKAFSGIGSNNGHEVTQRLFGYFLTWLQEKTSEVFVVATLNRLEGIPPEFLRKGRFDEIFTLLLPTESERKKIIEIHLRKKDLKCDNENIGKLSKELKNFSGAEIESLINEMAIKLFINYNKSARKDTVKFEDFADILKDFGIYYTSHEAEYKKMVENLNKEGFKSASRINEN